jgi:hypothetical protein
MRMLALLLVLAGCTRPNPPSPWEKTGVRIVNGVPQLGEVEIELERTECFGTCPAYSLRLSGDGTVSYTGKSYVRMKGEHTARFDPDRLLPLLERLQELDFLAANHTCSVHVVDNSHARIALRIGARANSAWDEIAGLEDCVARLQADDAEWHRKMFEVETAIDVLADSGFWIGTPAERGARSTEWR